MAVAGLPEQPGRGYNVCVITDGYPVLIDRFEFTDWSDPRFPQAAKDSSALKQKTYQRAMKAEAMKPIEQRKSVLVVNDLDYDQA